MRGGRLSLIVLTMAAAPAWATDDPSALEQREVRARKTFEQGLKLMQDRRWGEALAQFLVSRELKPLESNTLNAALCYRNLERFSEAVELFETLLRDYPRLHERALVLKALDALRPRLGELTLEAVPPGATVVVDGRWVGMTPLVGALRLSGGLHDLRVLAEGAEPFERSVAIAGGERQTLRVELLLLRRSGTLRLIETAGHVAQVWIDGVDRGRTPWEARLPVGPHVVTLVGAGELGTLPQRIEIQENETIVLRLQLEPLACRLQVIVSPPAARVSLNATDVGRGTWVGRVRCGSVSIEAGHDEFLRDQREFTTEPGATTVAVMSLERDPAAGWGTRSGRLFVEGAVFGSTGVVLGGAVTDSCHADCLERLPGGFAASLRAGYQFVPRVSLGLEVGWLSRTSLVTAWAPSIATVPDGAVVETSGDARRTIEGARVGLATSLERGREWLVQAGFGTGVFFGQVRELRRVGRDAESWGALRTVGSAVGVDVAIEGRLGRRLGPFDLALVLKPALLVLIAVPRWVTERDFVSSQVGLANFAADPLVNRLQWSLDLGLVARLNAL